jgi:hypothetical protein
MKPIANKSGIDGADLPNDSAELIGDWAERVMSLWELSRQPANTAVREASSELGDACLVRDALNNQLGLLHEKSLACPARSMQTLRDADTLFRQFTVESTTAQTLSAHDHYAHRDQWWWGRLPRPRAASTA